MTEGKPPHKILIDIAAAFSPANHSGVAHMVDMLPVCEQMVEGSGIGKGGVFAGRGIIILFFTIRTKGRSIKRYQCCTAGLRSLNIFDGRMNALHRSIFSGDQTNHGRTIACRLIVFIPCFPDHRILLDIGSIESEYQIDAG